MINRLLEKIPAAAILLTALLMACVICDVIYHCI